MASGAPILYNGADTTYNSYGSIALSNGTATINTDVFGDGILFINGIVTSPGSGIGQLFLTGAGGGSITIQSTAEIGNNNIVSFLILNSTTEGAPGAGPVSLMYLMGSGNNINVGTGTLVNGRSDIAVPGHTAGQLVIICRTARNSFNYGNIGGMVTGSGPTILQVISDNVNDVSSFAYLILPHPTSTNFSSVTAKIPPLITGGSAATCGTVILNLGSALISSTAITSSTICFSYIVNKTVGTSVEYIYISAQGAGAIALQSTIVSSTSTISWFLINL